MSPRASESTPVQHGVRLRGPRPRQDGTERLSDRQRAVAALIAAGMSNRAIASQLGLGRRTVDTHVRHILRKLGLRSRVQIGVWMVARGPR